MWPTIFNDDGTYIRTVGIWDASSKMSLGQIFVNGDVTTGKIRHRVLGGIDIGRKAYMADWSQGHNLDSLTHPFDPYHPDLGVPRAGYPKFDRETPLEERAQVTGGLYDTRYTSAYLQDELGFLDNKIRLTLALRYTDISIVTYGGAPQTSEHVTPRVGLSVTLTPTLSGYALYDQAFLPQNPLGVPGDEVKPITGDNREIGFKKNWGGGWSTTLSGFSILKNDELTANTLTSDRNDMIGIGQKRAQGIEFDLRGTVVRGLNAIFNYSYMNSKVTKGTPGFTEKGDVVPGFAKQTFNTWLTYKLQNGALRGLGASVGYTFLGDRATYYTPAPDPSKNLEDYYKLDAGLSWEKDRLKLTVNVFNVLDAYLYSGSYENWVTQADGETVSPVYSYQVEAPRNVRCSITYSF